MFRALTALLLATVAGGCATDGGPYPSLALRPIEKGSFDEPARPAAIVGSDAPLDAQIATQDAELTRLVAGFDAAAASATRAVERPSARTVGSDAWLDAQAALATLDDWRARTSALAATTETLASARAQRLPPAYPALDALAARAASETDRQAQAAAALQARLPAAG